MLAVFIGFCLLVVLMVAFCLLTPAVYSHAKPKTKKRVIELTCDGWLAHKLIERNWAASTNPLPFVVIILYWVHDSAAEDPDPLVRVHEFQHVFQDESNICFLVSWVKYFYELVSKRLTSASSWMEAYRQNKYEVAAYAVEDRVSSGTDPYPDWAK